VFKIRIAAVVLATFASAAGAQEVYVQLGTLGAGIGVAMGLNDRVGVHADIDAFDLKHSFNAANNPIDASFRLRSAGAYFDLYPFATSEFRLSAGVIANRDRASGELQPTYGDYTFLGVSNPTSGYYTFNGNRYPAIPGQGASVSVRMPAFMPYLGLGWGHKPTARGFGVTADIGVAYGRPRAGFDVAQVYQQYVAHEDLQREEDDIRSKIERYRLYPVVQVGVSYRF
jgi:hypothetical protein